MNVYVYNAEFYCEKCAKEITKQLKKEGKVVTDDSGDWPQGPYCDGGGESDCPQHCGVSYNCLDSLVIDGIKYGKFLENDITDKGIEYITEAYKDEPTNPIAKFWIEEYRSMGYDV